MIRVAVLISGRGSNLGAILRSWQTGELRDACSIVGVVSNRAHAGGLAIARAAGVPTLVQEAGPGQTRKEYDTQLLAALALWAPQMLVLAGFDRILSPVLVRAFPHRIVNIHPADPASYRGLHGYRWAFDHQRSETQVSVHVVDEGVDTGPVLAAAPVDLRGAATLAEVEARGLLVEHDLYPRALARFISSLAKES
jgi:phosphoribosylglycinamide formyltransferase 1